MGYNPGKTPVITNLALTLADTEYSHVIPQGTKKLTVQCRTDDEIKLSYVSGESGTKYITIYEGSSYSEDNLNTSAGLTIYLQSGSAGLVAEITTWTTNG